MHVACACVFTAMWVPQLPGPMPSVALVFLWCPQAALEGGNCRSKAEKGCHLLVTLGTASRWPMGT